jgi:formylglycine-generating enzyme required for sulfatase activity
MNWTCIKNKNRISLHAYKDICIALISAISVIFLSCQQPQTHFVNSMDMKLIRIQPGSFTMGENNETLQTDFDIPQYLTNGDWDEHPVHQVSISEPFYISELEVTLDQYRRYDPNFKVDNQNESYAIGVSWNDAVKFCRWLSEKEGKNYRLPTEAEWEYVCRAGSGTLFASGSVPPDSGYANQWGVKNMHTLPSEWVWDWYGRYSNDDMIDPVGPEW